MFLLNYCRVVIIKICFIMNTNDQNRMLKIVALFECFRPLHILLRGTPWRTPGSQVTVVEDP